MRSTLLKVVYIQMPNSIGLRPRSRLSQIPAELRLAHEYCFFLHDEMVRMLRDYENAEAHFVSVKFRNKKAAKEFERLNKTNDAITTLRMSGYEAEARRVMLNQITMGLVSDLLHHVFEALCCLEKRKFTVAMNLLRKPLTDSLLYLSWILGDEDRFYESFVTASPADISPKVVNNRRAEILSMALAKTNISSIIDIERLEKALFKQDTYNGFQRLFQHAVHLVTVQQPAFKTTSENFNFIFKSFADNDIFDFVYAELPEALLYLSHVVFGLFCRIKVPEDGVKEAFSARSVLGFGVISVYENEKVDHDPLADIMSKIQCPSCSARLKLTQHNAARVFLSENFRCTQCRKIIPFPFSYIF
jgi:hypothetical protein